MSAALEKFFIKEIAASGPMDMARFMSYALCHPEHGYYMKGDPLGVRGDFTTAPEISQMFGELIGAWIADTWMQMAAPEKFILLECGPGRGTLLADALRATKKVESFHKAAQIHLLETSPSLKSVQKDILSSYQPTWHETLETVPADMPIIVIANEFLDALPVRQIEKTKDGWAERVVVANDNVLGFSHIPVPKQIGDMIPEELQNKKNGFIFEFSPARQSFVTNLCERLKAQSGVALIVDYGGVDRQTGGTLSAIHKHEHVSPLDRIGECDLSAHVNFAAIDYIAKEQGINANGPVEQGVFLKNLGIEQRAEMLKAAAEDNHKEDIEKALHRLTASDQMGELFKVMGLSHGHSFTLAGF